MNNIKKEESEKNKIISVSVLPNQAIYIKGHKEFNFSQFVQIHLAEYINLAEEVEEIEREVGFKIHETTIR